MLKIAGAVIVIIASFGVGYLLCDNVRHRMHSVCALADFIDRLSYNISLYKTPLEEIYTEINIPFLQKSNFTDKMDKGFYTAAKECGLLSGDEESEIIKSFSDKLGGGSAEDMVKLCSFTSSRLRSIEERLRRDLPDKERVYRTISVIAGASAVIILI